MLMKGERDETTLDAIRSSCKICSGSGVIVSKDDNKVVLSDCKCIEKVAKEIALIRANIPRQYRTFDLRNLTKKFAKQNTSQIRVVKKYIDHLKENIENGTGIWFISAPGLGKSSMISYILKEAMAQGHTAYFERASHIHSLKFAALRDIKAKNMLNYIVNDIDIMAIEELEKIYLINDAALANQLFFEFLSDLYDTKKALLISTNIPRPIAEAKFPTYIVDRFRSLKTIIFQGESERVDKTFDGFEEFVEE